MRTETLVLTSWVSSALSNSVRSFLAWLSREIFSSDKAVSWLFKSLTSKRKSMNGNIHDGWNKTWNVILTLRFSSAPFSFSSDVLILSSSANFSFDNIESFSVKSLKYKTQITIICFSTSENWKVKVRYIGINKQTFLLARWIHPTRNTFEIPRQKKTIHAAGVTVQTLIGWIIAQSSHQSEIVPRVLMTLETRLSFTDACKATFSIRNRSG